MAGPSSLKRKISPPPTRKSSSTTALLDTTQKEKKSDRRDESNFTAPTLAAIEAGTAVIHDHLNHFSGELARKARDIYDAGPKLSIPAFRDLYQRNQNALGRHFVVHQHDHPISGVHYDLRLQFSASSSISFSVPYGLPGNPNSQRPNRMAIETRVHNVWNHLIESASHVTGSLLIWDTGEYEVLPRHANQNNQASATDDELSATSDLEVGSSRVSADADSTKLFESFRTRHLRLRLHGSRLPADYTIAMRLPLQNNQTSQPRKPKKKRRRRDPIRTNTTRNQATTDESDAEQQTMTDGPSKEGLDAAQASEAEDEDETIRQNNAYPGAHNTIGSIHQRQWFLTLDRQSSGFEKARSGQDQGRWVRSRRNDGSLSGFDPFFVRGREVERSVVTSRQAADIMEDEGVERYAGRKMWQPIMN